MQVVLVPSSQQQLTPLASVDTAGSDDLAGGQGQSEADRVVIGDGRGGRGHDPPVRHGDPVPGDLLVPDPDQLAGCGALLPQQVVNARGGQAGGTPADDDDVEVCRHEAILGRP